MLTYPITHFPGLYASGLKMAVSEQAWRREEETLAH
jgi:hypothetical protein